MEQLGPIEMARFLRSAEASVVRLTASYLARHADQLRTGDGSAAFVAVHALRGSLMAAAAHDPRLLQAPTFRQELVLLLEGYLRR
jgi:hypothetical protein